MDYLRVHVTDSKGVINIRGAELINLLSKERVKQPTHAEIKYFKGDDDAMTGENPIYQVFPLEQVFYVK